MVFNTLSEPLQDIVMVNFDFFLKLVLIVIMVGVCFYYIKTFNPKSDSPYIAVRGIRGILYMISFVVLSMSPFSIFLFYPQVTTEIFLKVLLWTYGVGFTFGGLIISFNVIQYGATFLFDLMGFETNHSEKQEGLEDIMGKTRRRL